MNNLTDKQFWLNYWESKKDLVFFVPDGFILTNFLDKIIAQQKPNNALEIGGFPAHYAIYLRRKHHIKATLLDFVVHEGILNDLLKINGLQSGAVDFIETDLFDYDAKPNFDLVFSNGLIEHFEDTQNIIQKHTEHLNDGGTLFLTLPNFKSLNGWFQQKFDPENYTKHNIKCMDIDLLQKTCEQIGLKNIEIKYDGRFMIWLENENQKSFSVRLFKKVIWFIGKVIFKIIPIESKWFSPYIILQAQK